MTLQVTFQAVFDVEEAKRMVPDVTPSFEIQVSASPGLLDDAHNHRVVEDMERLFRDGVVLRARDTLFDELISRSNQNGYFYQQVSSFLHTSDL
jgi:hypothetical protein